MRNTFTIDRDYVFYGLQEKRFVAVADPLSKKHYPTRIPPKKWPDDKLIGKAMVRGWAIPCKYYGIPPRGVEKKSYYYIFPGIPGGAAYEAIVSNLLEIEILFRKAENEKRKNYVDNIISFHESRRNNLQI